MLTYIFMKCLADLGIYFTLAVIPAGLFHVEYPRLWIAYLTMAAGLTLTWPLRSRRLLRWLPLLPALGLMIAAPGLPHRLILLPALIYCGMICRGNRYVLNAGQELDNFRLELILAGILMLFQLVLFARTALTSWSIPLAMIVLSCQILLMRALRHDPEVYCHISYRLRNLGILTAVLAGAAVASSPVFLRGALRVLSLIYHGLLLPVLLVLMLVVEKLLYVAFWLISLVMPDFQAQMQFDTGDTAAAEELREMMDTMPQAGLWGVFLRAILILLAIAAVCWLLWLLFQYISRSGRGIVEQDSQTTERLSLKEPRAGSPLGRLFKPRDPVMQVRLIYRNYLKLARSAGVEIHSWNTSAEILERSRLSPLPEEPAARLRQIYLAARYDGQATGEDVREAEALWKELKAAGR